MTYGKNIPLSVSFRIRPLSQYARYIINGMIKLENADVVKS